MTSLAYDPPRVADLKSLAHHKAPVLSFSVPVTASVPEASQNPVRHAQVVEDGLAKWRALGAVASEWERAREALAEYAKESSSPSEVVRSRIAYWSPGADVRVFGLPFELQEFASVASVARLRPVARAIQESFRYRVLKLSANEVALFEGDRHGLSQISTTLLPESLETTLGRQLTEPSLQFHSGRQSGSHPIYHGQGGAPDARRVDLVRFCQRIARGLESAIGTDLVPLVLASDARYLPEIKAALSRDVGLIEQVLEGNAEHLSTTELHEAAWQVVSSERANATETLRVARAGTKPLVTRRSELIENAVMGRIDRLWVPEIGSIPGRVDPDQARLECGWGDDDLIEGLLALVVQRGGSVEVVANARLETDPESLAAELRGST